MASLLPPNEPPDPVEGALGHFEHTNWVKQALKNLDAGTVHAAAGAAGALTVDALTVDNSADQSALISLKGNGVRSLYGNSSSDFARWQLILGDGTTEGGNNSGSLFKLYAFTDGGALAHTVLHADRTSGLVEVKDSPTTAKGVATKEYVDAAVPLGTIIAFGASTIPVAMQATWHMCDGTAHGSSTLQTLIGTATTPDLRGLFIVGAGKNADAVLAPTTYAMGTGAKLGKESVALTQANTPVKSHQHSIDHDHAAGQSGVGTSHSHTINHDHPLVNSSSDAHNHSLSIREGTGTGDGYYLDTNPTDSGAQKTLAGSVTSTDTHYHTVDVPSFSGSSGAEAAHTHSVNVAAYAGLSGAGSDTAATAHENRPPYYALTYIIKKV